MSKKEKSANIIDKIKQVDLILGFEKKFERKIAKSTIGTILAKSDA